ncbi:MAG: YdcF family protein [Ectothiorhodospiraceae bacterium]|nr:YdcF family protein [Chromatiales bacterium]MCP5153979.1 YdcF family protein [Ectothiorhodospiraceae bacterium]
MELHVVKVLTLLALPPGANLLLALLGVVVGRWYRRLGHILVAASLVALWLLSLPPVAGALARGLETDRPLATLADTAGARAIVILGGGRREDAPEYGADTVSDRTLVRLRYGAHLARGTGLPVLVSGGSVFGNRIPEAELMRDVLENELGVKVRWAETASRNTAENARESAAILRETGIRRVVLVTHASHMPRSAAAFEAAGLDVVPAPTSGVGPRTEGLGGFDFLPGARALALSAEALHEYLGIVWYRLRY